MFTFERDRETHSVSRGGAAREGDKESEAGSRLWVVSTESDAGLKLTNCEIMTWAEGRRSTDWATQAPSRNFLISPLIHCLFRRVLFNFYVFMNFPVLFLLLISGYTPLWLEKILGVISIVLNLLRLVLWPNMWSILENVPHALNKNVYSIVG